MNPAKSAWIILALGLMAVSVIQVRIEKGPAGSLNASPGEKIVSGTIRSVSEKSFQLCAQSHCLRVIAQVPADWKGHFVLVQGTLAENILLPKDNNAVDLTH